MRAARRGAAVALVAVGLLAGCSGDDGGSTPSDAPVASEPLPPDSLPPDVAPLPRLDAIDEAVAALEGELGGPQRYFEINATASEVNLFVANEDATEATAYVYDLDGTLQAPTDPQPASGNTFPASAIAVDADRVLGPVRAELPESVPIRFSVVGAGGDDTQYLVVLRSVNGGELVVDVDADGAILGGELIGS